MYHSDTQLIALARSAPVVSGWRFLLDVFKLLFRDHKMQSRLEHSPHLKVKTVYRGHTNDGKPGVKALGENNTWILNINKVTRIKDCGRSHLIVNGKVTVEVPLTKFFFGFSEQDEGDEQAALAIVDFEKISDFISPWEFDTYAPEDTDDE